MCLVRTEEMFTILVLSAVSISNFSSGYFLNTELYLFLLGISVVLFVWGFLFVCFHFKEWVLCASHYDSIFSFILTGVISWYSKVKITLFVEKVKGEGNKLKTNTYKLELKIKYCLPY